MESRDEDRISGNPPRSYPCSFCQKGFSNAQALGGHMNIHRRDRAKLREQTSDETMPSLDIATGNQLDHSQDFEDKDVTVRESSIEGKSSSSTSSSTPKRPFSLSKEEEIQQLPNLLFKVPSTFTGEDDVKASEGGRRANEERMRLVRRSSSGDRRGLDLELRLGPEPSQDQATTTKSTIEFF
ncbi:hypothetical protein SLEP1_g17840 [Rubroshorea leprosula]|uniref:C2H2-type domain-containing protein n=1 Tax=Rubroshorea leprosula TaxID=152421 RepID=A0AAV5J7B8_9ROSI|nr:hypothetical protein SLEP1_g17840 [Rubroshorea leprosula]